MMKSRNENANDRKKEWAIFVVNLVLPRPNQVRYQRVVALASEFNLIVVTQFPLPEDLMDLVREVHEVRGGWVMWSKAIHLAKRLGKEGQSFYIHTQYSLDPLITGYLCKAVCGCKWVYDLWDHPSLGWSSTKGLPRYARQLLWLLVLRRLIRKADAWIVAMHPGVLAHMPPAPVTCRLIFARPGYTSTLEQDARTIEAKLNDNAINVVFAGPISAQRGFNLIINWVSRYEGPIIHLHMIGKCDNEAESILLKMQSEIEGGANITVKIWGELPHKETLNILMSTDIGLCPVDPGVLNYRYAYPVKIVEYMSSGLIVVATEGHGVRALITDGENGFIGTYDAKGFCQSIDRAITACSSAEVKEGILLAARSVVDESGWNKINHELIRRLKYVVSRSINAT